jgi:dTDP-4-amino-4,6-dideoxygalactose transaminase
MKIIPYGRQFIDKQDNKIVLSSLKEDLITTGKYVEKFERNISDLLKSKYAISCSSGTSALHLSLMSIQLKKNDTIIMPAINFIASYNLSRFIGARIFLADVDKYTGQMTPKTLLECINKNKIKKIKAIVVMYMGGYPENVIEFYKIKKKFRCYLIEDACHGLGAEYTYKRKNFYIGSCSHSDIAAFSLHPVKTITTGEGGIVTTNNKLLAERIKSLRSHGIVRKKNTHWQYDVLEPGLNYRLSDINAALGVSQLKKIKTFIKKRKLIFDFYYKKLSGISEVTLPNYSLENKPSYHLFLISINNNNNRIKNKLLIFLKKNKITAQYHYIPIYKFSLYLKKKSEYYKNSEYYFNNTISLPIYFNLSLSQCNFIFSKLSIFFKNKIRIKKYS